MTRRKGEQPVTLPLDRWSSEHVVAELLADGDGWIDAWLGQKATPLVRLSKITGIPDARLFTLAAHGGEVSRAEIDALARAWSVSSTDLIASLTAQGSRRPPIVLID